MSKVLLVGGGGREHAMALALTSKAGDVELFATPGNPGIKEVATCVALAPEAIVDFAKHENIAWAVVGPEAPLVDGLADALEAAGIPTCGPSKAAAQLEGSKAFMRRIADEAGAPSPRFAVITNADELNAALADWPGLPVVKADGLAAGKGVFLPDTLDGCRDAALALLGGSLGDAGKTVVLEERLEGVEASLFYACAGSESVALPHARDHKRRLDDDQGPNTGGMGAISPNPLLNDALISEIENTMIRPTLRTMEKRGASFKGFLFAGVMLTQEGPKLLEYNVRLGDPEAQVILPRIKPGAFAELCQAVAKDALAGHHVDVDPRPTCAVVIAAGGYPEAPRKGDVINVADDCQNHERWVVHAGTREEDGRLLTHGGRVLAVVARGESPVSARQSAFLGVDKIHFENMHYRKDIGSDKTV